jgi:hypothetical protein
MVVLYKANCDGVMLGLSPNVALRASLISIAASAGVEIMPTTGIKAATANTA